MKPIEALEKRLAALEAAVEKHLMESGEIRTDLAWIKKALWVAIPLVASVPFTLLMSVAAYLMKH